MSETPYNIAWNIINRLSAADPAELFRKLASDAAKLEPLRKLGLTSSAILDLIWERENQSPTTIGCGLILPHARIPQLESLCAVCAVLENPLDCETPDDIPVVFGCMLLIPEERPMEGLAYDCVLKIRRLLEGQRNHPDPQTRLHYRSLLHTIESYLK